MISISIPSPLASVIMEAEIPFANIRVFVRALHLLSRIAGSSIIIETAARTKTFSMRRHCHGTRQSS